MKLTIAMLRKWNACAGAVKWAEATYPDGNIPLSAAKTVRRDWLRWLAIYANDSTVALSAYQALAVRADVEREDLHYVACYAQVATVALPAWRALAARDDVTREDLRCVACYAQVATVRGMAQKKIEKMKGGKQ